MTVDDRLRAAAEETRQRIGGLTRPRVGRRRLGTSTLRWMTATAAVLFLIVTIWAQASIEPPFDVEPGEVVLSVDPPIVAGAPSPAPRFDTNSLGVEQPLREIEGVLPIADLVGAHGRGELLKMTAVGMTELGSMAAFVDSSHLPCIWIDGQSGEWCRVIEDSSEVPAPISRGLAGTIAWGPLPSEVSAVVLEYGDMRFWQRPVAGVALFETEMSEGEDYALIAIDSRGETVLTATASFVP